jgi:putative colanic acid biosynthesis acetyltransferase WcaF
MCAATAGSRLIHEIIVNVVAHAHARQQAIRQRSAACVLQPLRDHTTCCKAIAEPTHDDSVATPPPTTHRTRTASNWGSAIDLRVERTSIVPAFGPKRAYVSCRTLARPGRSVSAWATSTEKELDHRLNELEVIGAKSGFVGPTFGFSNRLKRAAWRATWLVMGRWTPVAFHKWRILLLRAFGADVDWSAYVYPDAIIWAPWNLTIRCYGTLGRKVTCYNIAPVSVGNRAVVSQGAHLCTGTHDYEHPDFPLTARRIDIGRRAWVCADAFVGPGVTVGEGAVLAAAGAAFRDLAPWTIYLGNPAAVQGARRPVHDSPGSASK